MALFAIGLVMIFSTTSAEILDHDLDKSTYHAVVKQICYAVAGIAMALFLWKFGYERLLEWSPYLLLLFTFLLVLVLIPGVGKEVNGSKRWLNIAGLSLQPSEFVKYLVPAFFIRWILRREEGDLTFREFLRLAGCVFVPMLLILIEPNNGTAAVIGVTVAMLCFITGISFRYWAWPLLGLICIGAIFASQLPYVTARLNVYLHPELDLKGKGHQPYQAKIAAGSGQLFGKGPGNSLQKLSYLPEAQNDYIAAIFAEEFGFLGMVVLITLYALLGYLGFYTALHAPDPGGRYYAVAVTFLLCFQAFLNLGVVSGLLPSTGLNLPLFSQGGSSLMANACGLGLLLSIHPYPKREFYLS
jgi:cell division protein FtsW